MSQWWQKRSRRIWLALGYAIAGDVVLLLCIVAAFGFGIATPVGPHYQDLWLELIAGGMVVTLVFTIYRLCPGRPCPGRHPRDG